MSSRYLLFSVHGDAGPVRCVGHWRRRPTDAQVAAMREGGERAWWLVECASADAGRAIILATQALGIRHGEPIAATLDPHELLPSTGRILNSGVNS